MMAQADAGPSTLPSNVTAEPDSLKLEDYMPVDAERSRPIGFRVWIQWELRKKTLLGGLLVLPDNHRGTQFTGKVLKIGGSVPLEWEAKEGDRVMWAQFGGFEKGFDEKYGRIAIVEYFDIIAILPERTDDSPDIQTGEIDYDYSAS